MTFQVTTKHSIFLPGEHLKYLHFFPAQRRQISIPGMSENQVRWSGCDRNNLLEYKDGDDQDKDRVIVRMTEEKASVEFLNEEIGWPCI